jgi:hypothetical protein
MSFDVNPIELGDLIANAKDGRLLLPDFQREFVWKIDDVKGLAASILLEIPCGSLLFLNGPSDAFHARRIGAMEPIDSTNVIECDFVLDGQQRLSSLYSLLSDPFGHDQWEESVRGAFWNLRYRWALDIGYEAGKQDLFGLEQLSLSALPADPDSFRDRFIPHRIKLEGAGLSDWFHPIWDSGHAPFTEAHDTVAAQKASLALQVPLWRVGADGASDSSLHRRTLLAIANNQAAVIEAQLSGGTATHEIREAIYRVRPDLVDMADQDLVKGVSDLRSSWLHDMKTLISNLCQFEMAVVDMPISEVNRAIIVFEAMNKGGTPLSVFDLLTARLAKVNDAGNLGARLINHISETEITVTDQLWSSKPTNKPTSWSATRESIALSKDSLTQVFKNSFLSVLSVLCAIEDNKVISIEMTKPQSALGVDVSTLAQLETSATDAIMRAWCFLQIRCGVRSESDLRNKLLILPLAIALRSPHAFDDKSLLDRVEYWYWSSVLTKTYTERQNDNAADDTRKLLNWLPVNGTGSNPFVTRRSFVMNDPAYSDKDTLLRRNEDAGVATDVGTYLLQFELSQNPYDLLSSTDRVNAWESSTHDHHLVPLATAKTIAQSSREIRKSNQGIGRLLNSPLNRSFIGAKTNLDIGSLSITNYLHDVPLNARISRGLPDLESIYKSIKDDPSGVETVARKVMEHRFSFLSDSVQKRLDQLVPPKN